MRLWHPLMIPHLPHRQLQSQHCEICGMRGNGWGKPHATVDYVWQYPPGYLYRYHVRVMDELIRRGVNVDLKWYDKRYRGRNCKPWIFTGPENDYPEHNTVYLAECILNLMSGERPGGGRKNKVLNPLLDGVGVMR